MTGISLVDVTKHFQGKPTLAHISLEVINGEFMVLLGPSGSGKSTLLKIIAGLELPTTGRVYINGVDVTFLPSQSRQAIIVFQDHSLFPHMTVSENVSFGLRARGESRQLVTEKVRAMLDIIQLPDRAHSFPHELSGGEKQRVALARACVLEPSVLLLDEPFSNLDVNLRLSMREFVSALHSRLKFTCILVTHDKEEAFLMSQRVAVLLDNRLLQVATPEKLYEGPQSLRVASFLGERNIFPGRVQGGYFHSMLGAIPCNRPDQESVVGTCRFDQVSLSSTEGEVPGRIVQKAFAGRFTTYKIELAQGMIVTAVGSEQQYLAGDTVHLSVEGRAVLIYGAEDGSN